MKITLADITPEKAECNAILDRIRLAALLLEGDRIFAAKDEHVGWIRASLTNAFAHLERARLIADGGDTAQKEVNSLERIPLHERGGAGPHMDECRCPECDPDFNDPRNLEDEEASNG